MYKKGSALVSSVIITPQSVSEGPLVRVPIRPANSIRDLDKWAYCGRKTDAQSGGETFQKDIYK